MGRLPEAARWPTNLSKVSEIVQGEDGSSRDFLESVMEACKDLHSVRPGGQREPICHRHGLGQSSHPDIFRRLEHLRSFVGKQLTESVAVAENIFNSLTTPEDGQTRGESAAHHHKPGLPR